MRYFASFGYRQIRDSTLPNLHAEALGQALVHAMRNAGKDRTELPETTYSPVLSIEAGQRDVAPFFCIPGAGSNVTTFVDLTSRLSRAWPIFGLQPRGLDGLLVPHSTVIAAAEFYLRAINRSGHKAPMHLLGHSFGGWVVLEMARMLLESGRPVASLSILDSSVPDEIDFVVREYNNTEAIMRWTDLVEQLLGRSLHLQPADLDCQEASVQRQLLHSRLVSEAVVPARSHPDMLIGPLRTFASMLRTHYKPAKVYPGPVHLLLVNDPKLDPQANRLMQEQVEERWKRSAPSLTCTHVPGNHVSILKPPHVNALAEALLRSLTN